MTDGRLAVAAAAAPARLRAGILRDYFAVGRRARVDGGRRMDGWTHLNGRKHGKQELERAGNVEEGCWSGGRSV